MELKFDVYQIEMSRSGGKENLKFNNVADKGKAIDLWQEGLDLLSLQELKGRTETDALLLDWSEKSLTRSVGEVRRGKYGDMGSLRKASQGELLPGDPANGYFLPVFFSAFLPDDSRIGILLLEKKYGSSALEFFNTNLLLLFRDRFGVSLKIQSLLTSDQFDDLVNGEGRTLTFYSKKPPANAMDVLRDIDWPKEKITSQFSIKVKGRTGAALGFLGSARARGRVYELAPSEMDVDHVVLTGKLDGIGFSLNMETGQTPRPSISVEIDEISGNSRPTKDQFLQATETATEVIRARIVNSERSGI